MTTAWPRRRLPFGVGLWVFLLGLWISNFGAAESELRKDPKAPNLQVQMESDYVTDPSRWGRLIYDPSRVRFEGGSRKDREALAALIGGYHRAWLARDAASMNGLLDPEAVRFRQGRLRSGRDAVMVHIANESRGERPEGQAGSTQLSLRDVEIRIAGDTGTAFYRMDAHVGARWEYADVVTVFQAFRKEDDRWRLLHHVETMDLDDPGAPELGENVPSRRAPFVLDFVYPVKDLSRASQFYTRFLGNPEQMNADRAIYRFRASRFVLEARPLDERITIKEGAGNGYGIISVPDIQTVYRSLVEAGALRVDAPRGCGPDRCVFAEDPSGNLVVFRERRAHISDESVRPTISLEPGQETKTAEEVEALFAAWAGMDASAMVERMGPQTRWVDDSGGSLSLGAAMGTESIRNALEARWRETDRGSDGLALDLTIRDLRVVPFGEGALVTFALAAEYRGPHASREEAFVTQIWSQAGEAPRLELSFLATKRQVFSGPVNGMDYTAYPLHDLGRDGRFYKQVLGVEPYRDANWFGFWSTSSVFGMFEKDSGKTAFRPYPHRNNGYADLNIRSAEEVLRLLEEEGAALPHVPGINNEAGIDLNPGYKQVLAVDPEGNLINFSEYLEY